MKNQTLIQKIGELNKKGIMISFAPSADNSVTIIEVEDGTKWKNYMLTSEMINYAKESIIHQVLDDLVEKLYK